MSIGQIASSIWSSATTALTTPNSATVPVSLASPKANGASRSTTGHANPFQALSPDLQSWILHNQAGAKPGGAQGKS
jgi:hypothetical protein